MASGPKSEAEARYARAQKRQQEATKAQSDFQVEAKRVDANTLRLRGLRLAKEAADAKALADAPPPVKAKRKAKPKPAKAAAKSIPVEELDASDDG